MNQPYPFQPYPASAAYPYPYAPQQGCAGGVCAASVQPAPGVPPVLARYLRPLSPPIVDLLAPPPPAAASVGQAVAFDPTAVIQIASTALSAYHGYKRNDDSASWAAVWGLFGFVAPIITPIVAVIQGYAEPKR